MRSFLLLILSVSVVACRGGLRDRGSSAETPREPRLVHVASVSNGDRISLVYVERLLGVARVHITWVEGKMSFSPRQVWVGAGDSARTTRVLREQADLTAFLVWPDEVAEPTARPERPWNEETVDQDYASALARHDLRTPMGRALRDSRMKAYVEEKKRPYVRDARWRQRLCIGTDDETHDAIEFRFGMASSPESTLPWSCDVWLLPD